MPAFASTLSDKRAQAAAVKSKIDDLTNQAEIASQRYDAALGAYDDITAKVDSTKRPLARLTRQTGSLQSALGNQADEMYRQDSPVEIIEEILSSRSIEEFNSTIELIQRIGDQNAATIDKLKQVRSETAADERVLVVSQRAANVQKNAMGAAAKAVKARLADSRQVLASVTADIRAILAAQAAAEAAAARRAAAALQRRGGGGPHFDPGGNPPKSSKGAAAVWWAEKEIGKPYRWGASGPNSFDCSGLMVWAYRHVGISLPHYSGAQINVGSRVGRANLQPGDLVFFGSPIHHVGMYIGNGEFVEAPYTGADVRVASLGGRYDYAGACRP